MQQGQWSGFFDSKFIDADEIKGLRVVAESVHVYQLIAGTIGAVYFAFFLASMACSKFTKLAIDWRGDAIHAVVCTILLFSLASFLALIGPSPELMIGAILIGVFSMNFALMKKLVPRLIKNASESETPIQQPSALQYSLIHTSLSTLLLGVASYSVFAYFF